MKNFSPLIVGIGGTTRAGSASEMALRCALKFAEAAGASTKLLVGPALDLPMYTAGNNERPAIAHELVNSFRESHGIIVASPGYHGSISGLIKNALDYVEEMRGDRFAYFDRRAVGCIACAFGWQATGSTLATLRSIAHALRGWPTPVGVAINSSLPIFDKTGSCIDAAAANHLKIMATQVVEFARMCKSLPDPLD